jgi:hypothetical protein
MIKQITFFLIGFIFLFSNINAATNVSCGNSYGGVDNYFLNKSLSIDGSNCLTFTSGASNSILDCQGFNITGNNSNSGIYLNGVSNMNISNCNIHNFNLGINMVGAANNNLTNIISNNNSAGIGMSMGSNNNIFNMVTLKYNNNGINIDQNNNITNSIIVENINSNLYFWGNPSTSFIFGNILGNISKINSADWSVNNNKFNYSGIGNTYYNSSGFGTGQTICFDVNNCDYIATIQVFPVAQSQSQASTRSEFPVQGFVSILLTISLIFGYFIFS